MKKSEQIRVLEALNEHIATGSTTDAGGVVRAPMSDFTDPDLFLREKEKFFCNEPLCMGLSSELPKPNTFWSDNATGMPMLMVRDDHGHFRAFANVCRHRGSLVVEEGRGTRRRFTCPFHAWTYGNDGELIAVNKSTQFGDVSNLGLSLLELPAAELHGTLWVRPIQGDSIDEEECLGGLQDDFENWNLPDYPYIGMQIIDARMNWKLTVDSYGEIYHLNVLHKETIGDAVIGNAQTLATFGKNLRMVVANQKFNLLRMMLPFPERWPYKQVTSTVYFLYPNVIMMIDSFGVDFLRIFPLNDSPSYSRTIHTWYIDPKVQKQFEEQGLSHEDKLKLFRESVEQEDYVMGADVQVNAEREVQREIVLGRNEESLQHFHNTFRSALGRELLQFEST